MQAQGFYIFLPGGLAGSLNLAQEAHLGKCPEIDISFPYVESLSSFHIWKKTHSTM